MNYRQLVKHYGSEVEAARALKLHRQTVNKWKKRIPIDQQIRIEVRTAGELIADIPASLRETQVAA